MKKDLKWKWIFPKSEIFKKKNHKMRNPLISVYWIQEANNQFYEYVRWKKKSILCDYSYCIIEN